MAESDELYGSCACERNQYTILIPHSTSSLAHVYLDNSATNRISQATPLTAWLRVPLEWFHSTTYAQFPDETHGSIRRTFYSPTTRPEQASTRRQFCGYCGTHLTAWNEGQGTEAAFLDVTLGSLAGESMDRLESLNLISDHEDEEQGNMWGVDVEDEEQNESMGGVKGPGAVTSKSRPMQHREMSYFEELVENSRLGRMKRQKGGHTSRDGKTTIQWEVLEIEGDESSPIETDGNGGSNKRQKVDV